MRVFRGVALFTFFLAAVLVTFLGRSALDDVRSEEGSHDTGVKKGRVKTRIVSPYGRPDQPDRSPPTNPKKSKQGKLQAEFVSSAVSGPPALVPQSSFLPRCLEEGSPFCLDGGALEGIDPATILRLPGVVGSTGITFRTISAHVYPRVVSPTK
jgi:hypothetical protein